MSSTVCLSLIALAAGDQAHREPGNSEPADDETQRAAGPNHRCRCHGLARTSSSNPTPKALPPNPPRPASTVSSRRSPSASSTTTRFSRRPGRIDRDHVLARIDRQRKAEARAPELYAVAVDLGVGGRAGAEHEREPGHFRLERGRALLGERDAFVSRGSFCTASR